MITTYRTIDGDMLDAICKQHYGTEAAVAAVLEANVGLEAQPARLLAGLQIVLPELAAATTLGSASAPARLWGAV